MSDGLYEAYEAWTNRPDRVNEDIAHLVAQELKNSVDLKLVAQNVVDKVKSLYRNTCKKDRRSGRLDDITLVIKTLGHLPLTRSQSTISPRHHVQPYPPSYIPPTTTAPVTDKQFDFRGRDQFAQQQQGRPVDQRGGDYSQGGFMGPQYNVHYDRQEGFYPPPRQPHPQQSWRGGGWDPRYGGQGDYRPVYDYSTGGGYGPQPSLPVSHGQPPLPPHHHAPPPRTQHPAPPLHMGPSHHQVPQTQPMSNQPISAHFRQESDPRHDYGSGTGGHKETKPFTPLPVSKPHKATAGAEGRGEYNTGSNAGTNAGTNAGSNVGSNAGSNTGSNAGGDYNDGGSGVRTGSNLVQPEEEKPPPVPPRMKSIQPEGSPKSRSGQPSDEDMYGWKLTDAAAVAPQTSQTPDIHAQDPRRPVQEPQTVREDPAPLNQNPPPPPPSVITTDPQTLPEGPSQSGEVGVAAVEEPQTLDEEDGAHDDFVYVEDREEVISSPEEEEDDPSGGTIKPYIRFTDRFPTELSWDEIKIDP